MALAAVGDGPGEPTTGAAAAGARNRRMSRCQSRTRGRIRCPPNSSTTPGSQPRSPTRRSAGSRSPCPRDVDLQRRRCAGRVADQPTRAGRGNGWRAPDSTPTNRSPSKVRRAPRRRPHRPLRHHPDHPGPAALAAPPPSRPGIRQSGRPPRGPACVVVGPPGDRHHHRVPGDRIGAGPVLRCSNHRRRGCTRSHRRPGRSGASGSHHVSGAVPDASAAPRRLLDLPRRRAARRADADLHRTQCPVRTAGRRHRTNDHDRSRHRRRPVPRLPP